ncbi:MAG: hypothetical protein ACRC1M_00450 [Methanobacteriaceae archaeon]
MKIIKRIEKNEFDYLNNFNVKNYNEAYSYDTALFMYEQKNILGQYLFYRYCQDSKNNELKDMFMRRVHMGDKGRLGLLIDPYVLYHFEDKEEMLKEFNISTKKRKKYYTGKTREYLENPDLDIIKYEGEIFLFTPKDLENTAEINAVRWMGAFGYHSDLTEMLDFEISGARQRACEIISIGRKNGLEIDPFLTKKSNLNTGFGLLYNEEDINEIFEADVWSDVSARGNLFSQRNDDQDYSGCGEYELAEMLLNSNWSHTEAFLKKTAKLKGIYLAGASISLLDKIQKWISERGLKIDIYLDETTPNRENNPFRKDYNFTKSLEVFLVNKNKKIKEERNVYDHYICGDLYGDFFEENRLDLDV